MNKMRYSVANTSQQLEKGLREGNAGSQASQQDGKLCPKGGKDREALA